MRILAIGEGMAEFRQDSAGGWHRAHGGDVVNTAIHLARFGFDSALFSALGLGAFSDYLFGEWQGEGLQLDYVSRTAQADCGVYFIAVDAHGERTFTYRRKNSAATLMMQLADEQALRKALMSADLIYFSLISLAILAEPDRQALLDSLGEVRAAGKAVAFDNNYRPQLWGSAQEARLWHGRALRCVSIGLPTMDDDIALGIASDHASVAAHWHDHGVAEIVVKAGRQGALVDGAMLAPDQAIEQPTDTSGAGDAFNGGYLAARLHGKSRIEAARAGNKLAGWVVQQRGAIPPVNAAMYRPGDEMSEV